MQDKVVKIVDTWLKSGLKSEHIQQLVRERSLKLSTATRRVLYCKRFGGFGFSEEFTHAHGLTEYSDFDKERSSERAFATIERLGQGICTSAPYVCQDIELCQRLNLQKLGEQIHKQRFREKAQSEANGDKSYEADLHQCLETLQDWPTDVLHAARAYYDTEGFRYWSLFISGGGPFQYSTDCTFSKHIELKKTAWPLHEAFRVSGMAGGCLIAATFRDKFKVTPSASVAAGQASESPQLILGLAAASSMYCALSYANVPELADFKVHEYDGKESVVW